jgi:YD repeat-containing protein
VQPPGPVAVVPGPVRSAHEPTLPSPGRFDPSSRVGDLIFDNVAYDDGADVLYLHAGEPSLAVEFDESPEGHALRYDHAGRLVGITIVNAKWLLERDGQVTITLPQPVRVDRSALAAVIGTG